MIALRRWKSAFAMALLFGAVLVLAACSSGVKSMQAAGLTESDFGVVVQSAKGGQFLLNGAIISPLDLSSHFAYLRDQHKLPKTVLLERSDKQKIHKEQLRAMATMALKYGFTVYFNEGGKLRRIEPNVKNEVKLKDAPPPSDDSHSHVDQYDATHSGA